MAPLIAGLLGQGLNLLANAALAKGKEFVEEKTGIKLDDAKPIDPETAAKLKIAEMEHEEELLRIQQEDNRLEKEIAEMYLKDTSSAREREVRIATSTEAPYLNKIIVPVLAIGILVLSFLLFGVILFVEVETNQKDILIYVLGVLSAICTQVVAYYFGSSQGSTAKDQTLKRILQHGAGN